MLLLARVSGGISLPMGFAMHAGRKQHPRGCCALWACVSGCFFYHGRFFLPSEIVGGERRAGERDFGMADASGSKRRGGREVEERSSKTRRVTPSASLPPTPMRQTHAQEVVQHTSGPWTYIKDGVDPQEALERVKKDGFEDIRDVVKCQFPCAVTLCVRTYRMRISTQKYTHTSRIEDALGPTKLHPNSTHKRRWVQIRCTWRFSTQSHPAKRCTMSASTAHMGQLRGDSSPARWGGRRRKITRKSLRSSGWTRICTI